MSNYEWNDRWLLSTQAEVPGAAIENPQSRIGEA